MDAPIRISDDRRSYERALRRARVGAYAPGEYVEQESFMRASEIRALAEHAGIGAGVSLLDLCCGVAGPGRFIAGETGCEYLGVDGSEAAIQIARERAGTAGLPCRFDVARVPPLPAGEFDVALMLETMLAFPEKEPLLRGISGALAPGGRFAFTLEEGAPLTEAERERMPGADTVWPTPLHEMHEQLERVGLTVSWEEDHTRAHCEVAERLTAAFEADVPAIAAVIGRPAVERLVAAHRVWCEWLAVGRVRKFAVVAHTSARLRDPATEFPRV